MKSGGGGGPWLTGTRCEEGVRKGSKDFSTVQRPTYTDLKLGN
jgi:hypothetical protein